MTPKRVVRGFVYKTSFQDYIDFKRSEIIVYRYSEIVPKLQIQVELMEVKKR